MEQKWINPLIKLRGQMLDDVRNSSFVEKPKNIPGDVSAPKP